MEWCNRGVTGALPGVLPLEVEGSARLCGLACLLAWGVTGVGPVEGGDRGVTGVGLDLILSGYR